MNYLASKSVSVSRSEKYSKKFTSWFFLSVLSSVLLTACGGGSSASSNPSTSPSASSVISGVADKGPVSGGTVTAYAVTSAGVKGSALGTTTTDSSGNYSLTLDYTGPVLLEITGGSYIDEASGNTINVPTTAGSGLQAVVSSVTAGNTVAAQITPLTSMAAARAEAMTGGLTASNITTANQDVGNVFGGIDILNAQPINPRITNSATGASQNAVNYGLILAGISDEANTLGLSNPFDLVTALTQDYSDGTLNGVSGAGAVQLNDSAMNPSTGTTLLATAISNFVGDQSLNLSGGNVPLVLLTTIGSTGGSSGQGTASGTVTVTNANPAFGNQTFKNLQGSEASAADFTVLSFFAETPVGGLPSVANTIQISYDNTNHSVQEVIFIFGSSTGVAQTAGCGGSLFANTCSGISVDLNAKTVTFNNAKLGVGNSSNPQYAGSATFNGTATYN